MARLDNLAPSAAGSEADTLPSVPKGSICTACAHRHRDCSDLPFDRMPAIAVRDGVRFVQCLNFERG